LRERAAVLLSSGRLVRWVEGGAAHVEFDGAWALAREEARGDVAGFFHTHPPGVTSMSGRDRRTMQAWAIAFGRPLLAAVRSGEALRVWICDKDGGAFEVSDVPIVRRLFDGRA
jgi:proteasome lid subunit RPN8/RPN11